MSEARYQSAADLLDPWRDDVLSGKPPTLYPVGTGELARIEIGPGLVTLIGGAPGAGKTALTLQWVLDALSATPSLKALILNVEMSPSTLLDRQLARLAGIDGSLIRHRRLTAEHAGPIERGMEALESIADRLAFVRPPFDLANVALTADAFDAGLILIDYIQRVRAPGEHGDRRGAVDATMDYLRQFADAGVAIIVVAALARSKDAKGRSSYSEGLSLASFRETSELEYGADDGFILAPADDDKSDGQCLFPCHPEAPEEPARRDAGYCPELRPQAPAVYAGTARRARKANREGQAPGGSSRSLGQDRTGSRRRRG